MHEDDGDTMRDEYDFSKGVRGKHHQAYRPTTNVALLKSDVAAAPDDSATVNLSLTRDGKPSEAAVHRCGSSQTVVLRMASGIEGHEGHR